MMEEISIPNADHDDNCESIGRGAGFSELVRV